MSSANSSSAISSSKKNIINYIHLILREIISEDKEFDFCLSLCLDDYSDEDIAEFLMRKFLKYINNNFELVAYHKNELNTIVEEDITQESINEENNTIIQEDLIQKSINEENTITQEFLNQKSINEENTITQEDITQESINEENNTITQEDINTNDKNKYVKNKSGKKNAKKKSKGSKQEDFEMNIYISKFKEGEHYINDKRIEIFNKPFDTDYSSTKIPRLITGLFTVSSTHINDRKTKTFQIIPIPKVKNPKKDITIPQDITQNNIPILEEDTKQVDITQKFINEENNTITQEDIIQKSINEDNTITQEDITQQSINEENNTITQEDITQKSNND
jgi:hypothetical protein